MVSVALGLSIIFIFYVMIWSIKNDGVRSINDQTGLLRMRDPSKGSRKRVARFGEDHHAAATQPTRNKDQR